VVYSVEWNPNPDLCLFAVAVSTALYIVLPKKIISVPRSANTEQFFTKDPPNDHNIRVKNLIEWRKPEPKEYNMGIRMVIELKGDSELKFTTWHHKGDYIATVCPEGNRSAVFIHQLSKMQTQNPFIRNKGLVQCVRFHPTKPHFFVVTQRSVKYYNLAQQKLIKKLMPSSQWISSLHVHPGGIFIYIM